MDSDMVFCYNSCHNVEGVDKTARMSEKTKPPTILYVEDDANNRTLIKRVLTAEGYEVVEAEDGPDGIELARTTQPDLILMDINLPDMDGYEATARLRTFDDMRGIPIIALTANVMRGDRERTLAAGCSGYIQKPIDVDRLPAQVAAFLRR
jgi:two-component system cell cycle response regulator DivK